MLDKVEKVLSKMHSLVHKKERENSRHWEKRKEWKTRVIKLWADAVASWGLGTVRLSGSWVLMPMWKVGNWN